MFHNLVTAVLFEVRIISPLEFPGDPVNGDVQTGEDRLDPLNRVFVVAALRLHSSHQELDYQVIDGANAAVIDAETQGDDHVPGVLRRVVDCFQAIDSRLGKAIQPAEKSIGDKCSIWNHNNAAATPTGGATNSFLQVILNKSILLNETDLRKPGFSITFLL